jgi:hypothetical protein
VLGAKALVFQKKTRMNQDTNEYATDGKRKERKIAALGIQHIINKWVLYQQKNEYI